MSTIWIGTILSALLLTVSILVLGGYTIRSRMERPIAWGRLVLLDLPFVLGITVLLLWAGMDAAYILRVSILSSFLPLVAVIDHREMIIPNRILLWMLTYWGLAMALQIWQMGYPNPNVLLDFILGGLIGASPLLVRLVSKGGIGMGDIKLFAIVGLYVGKQDILRAMFLSLVIALFVLLGRKLRKKLEKKQEISFGPFVAAGTMLMVVMNVPIF